MKQRMNQLGWIATASVALLLLGGCAPESSDAGSKQAPDASSSQSEVPAEKPAETPTEPANEGPREQAEDCGWSDPALAASVPTLPTAQDGELQNMIVGAWQHTHFDTGAGYEPVDNDIRYIFPSTERILYCQHVPSVTDYAENAAPITWDGTRIVLPGSAPGYVVSEWNDSTMVWINRMDDSRYLLQRR